MADYRKMYATLCSAIDREIDDLKEIPLAYSAAGRLEDALHRAEEIYIETTSYAERTAEDKIMSLRSYDSDGNTLGSQRPFHIHTKHR